VDGTVFPTLDARQTLYALRMARIKIGTFSKIEYVSLELAKVSSRVTENKFPGSNYFSFSDFRANIPKRLTPFSFFFPIICPSTSGMGTVAAAMMTARCS
jgi:hypothetical protein